MTAILNGQSGASLPTASGAGEVPVSTGAGTTYAATALSVPTRGSGTLAARPASPAAGDTYAVTSGASTGARYVCFVTGSWEGTVPFATGHSYDRLAAATAGGGARFLDVDSLQLYTSSGDDAVRWGVELPSGLGPDAAAAAALDCGGKAGGLGGGLGVVVLGGGFDDAGQAARQAIDEGLEVLMGGRVDLGKLQSSLCTAHVHTVEHERPPPRISANAAWLSGP